MHANPMEVYDQMGHPVVIAEMIPKHGTTSVVETFRRRVKLRPPTRSEIVTSIVLLFRRRRREMHQNASNHARLI